MDHPERVPSGSWNIPSDSFYEAVSNHSSYTMTLPMSTTHANAPTALGLLLAAASCSAQRYTAEHSRILNYSSIRLHPQNYTESLWYNSKNTAKQYRKLSEQVGKRWPKFNEARLLAKGGYYDWAGPVFGEFFEAYSDALKDSNHSKHASAKAFNLNKVQWKPFFYYTRDHFDTMRHNYGTWKSIKDPKNSLALEKMHWPIAHGATVWEHSQKHKVDPYLVLSIMRAESRHDATAISRRFRPMQIMPRTGHLIALAVVIFTLKRRRSMNPKPLYPLVLSS